MGIPRIIQSPERLAQLEHCATPRLCPATNPGMDNDRGGAKLRHEAVSLLSQRGRHAALVRVNARDDEQPPRLQRTFPLRWHAHPFDTSCRTDDDGLSTAQQEVQTITFDRSVEPAGNCYAVITECARQVIG